MARYILLFDFEVYHVQDALVMAERLTGNDGSTPQLGYVQRQCLGKDSVAPIHSNASTQRVDPPPTLLERF